MVHVPVEILEIVCWAVVISEAILGVVAPRAVCQLSPSVVLVWGSFVVGSWDNGVNPSSLDSIDCLRTWVAAVLKLSVATELKRSEMEPSGGGAVLRLELMDCLRTSVVADIRYSA